MESARDSARELTNSGPTFSEHDWDAVIAAVGRALEEPAIAEPTRGRGRPRKYSFYDLDVGQSCRMPMSAGTSNIHAHARATGKLFTTRAKANGRWIKRVA